jgi:hypothetical protein
MEYWNNGTKVHGLKLAEFTGIKKSPELIKAFYY